MPDEHDHERRQVRHAPRRQSLRTALGWLLATALVPLAVAGAAILSHQWRQQRELALEHLQGRARTLQRAVDREIALDQAVLSALAASGDIDTGDWRAFHAAASHAAGARPGSWFVLYDATGQNVVNTSVPYGTPLPNFRDVLATRSHAAWEGRELPLPGAFLFTPFETARPSFSGLFFGPLNRRPVVASTVPVLRDGKARFVLALAYSSEFFVRLLQAERAPDGVVTALLDGTGLIVARSRAPERFVAHRAGGRFGAASATLPDEGVGEGTNLESTASVYAYARSAMNDWIAVVTMPRAQMLAPAWRALWIWLGVLLAAGAAGCVLAYRLWRRLGVPLGALAHQARSLGEPYDPVAPSGIDEVEALRTALHDAAVNEQVRRDAEREREEARRDLRASEQRLRAIFEDAAVGIIEVDGEDRLVAVNERFCRMLGYTRGELLGRSIHELTAPADRDVTRDLNARVHSGELAMFDYEKQYVRRDGSSLWVHVNVSAVRDAGGRFVRAVATIEDVTERRRAQDALRESEEKFRSVFEQAAIGMGRVSFTDASWIDVNDAFCRMLGYTREYMQRTPWPEITHPDDVELDLVPFRRMAAGELDSYTVEKRFRHAEGRYLWARLTLSAVRDADGRPAYEIAIIEDITAQRAAEQGLRDADRRKDEFLGMLSHELRNPLAPIRSSVYLLARADPGSEQATRARRVIERQTEHLTRLVDDLLDVTRIARGKILLHRTRVDLRELVARVADDAHVTVERRGIALRAELPPDPVWADADATRITQALGNLVHNAAKFTRQGGTITLSLRPAGRAAELAVHDTGAGIEPELLPTLFDAFVQGERTLARSEGGLGLGLALVKGLVELHGGSVRAHSEGPGRGAVFTITLPVTAAAADVTAAAPPGAGVSTTHRRVLVVDDNVDAAETLAQLVELFGHRAEVAYDGPSALEKVRRERPDVVLCDLGLPGMTGYEVARRLRETEDGSVRLVAVSGYAQPDDVQRAVQAGFDAHVAKPADPASLEQLLR